MKKLIALTALLAVGGCQTFAPTEPTSPPPTEEAANLEPQAPQEQSSFSREGLYALLVAELAGQRNRFDIALGNYVQQAHGTQDAAVAERAFRIAEYLGAEQAALDMALIWAQSAPNNLDAQRTAAVQLARAGRYEESLAYMEAVLGRQGDTHFDFLALSAARTDPETRAGLLQSFDRLLSRNPGNPQLVFGKALLLEQDGQTDEALDLLERQPRAERPAPSTLLHARILQSHGREGEALTLLQQTLRRHPEDTRLRLAYARLLVEQDRLEEAMAEFSTLLQQNPSDDDLRLSLALVAMEAEAWREAIVYLEDLIERGSHLDTAYLNLGRAQQSLGRTEKALAAYAQVEAGNEFLAAKALEAELLMAKGRSAEASALLQRTRQAQPDYAIQLYLLEAEALSSREQVDAAWALVADALEQFPDDANLLYTRAMLAEKRDDLEQLERDLRLILEREPENAMALNALGYTFADRTDRLDEARQLIEQAHQLNPEDPATLDSLGWVHYRQGNLKEAERWLRKALERLPDAEIAAHLGEVLWQLGERREARRIWRDALQQNPENKVLRETLRRLTGSETL